MFAGAQIKCEKYRSSMSRRNIVLIVLYCGTFQTGEATDNCTIPGGETGKCVPIHNCSIILEGIKTEEQAAIKFAKRSQCGTRSDNVPLVCCGNTNNFTTLPANLLPSRSYCGYQHSDDYLTNRWQQENDTSSIDEFPWLAALFYRTKRGERNLCVGSLINERYVLTAAQCLRPPRPNITLIKVRLGEYNLELQNDCIDNGHLELSECSDPASDFGVEEILVHDLYDTKDYENDIGLIRLNTSVQYSDYVRPICLPLPETPRAKVGNTLAESGWGKNTFRGGVSKIKKKISTKLISNAICANTFKQRLQYRLRPGQMCTKDILANTTGTCQGDAGGPVMFSHKNQWSQEGIVSVGGNCASGIPDVHTRVADYLNWIIKNIRP